VSRGLGGVTHPVALDRGQDRR